MNEKPVEIEVVDAVDPKVNLKKEIQLSSGLVSDLVIKDDNDYAMAETIGKSVSQTIKNINEYFNPLVKLAHKAHKEAKAIQNDFLKVPEQTKATIKALMLTYENEQERIRKEKEDKLRRDLKAKQDEDQAKRQAQLDKDIEAGIAQADAICEAVIPDFQPEDIVVASTIKPKNTRDHWVGEVKDFQAFVEAIVKTGRFELLAVNQSALNNFAKSTKGKSKIPGLEIRNDKIKVL